MGKRKKLTLITELFFIYMEPLFPVSWGKTGEADTGKRLCRAKRQMGM